MGADPEEEKKDEEGQPNWASNYDYYTLNLNGGTWHSFRKADCLLRRTTFNFFA